MKTIYDVIIVGGGIAGLHRAYTLLKSDPSLRVLILEATQRWGGRVHTYYEWAFPSSPSSPSSLSPQNPSLVLEYGAGRFQRHHHKLWQLLDEMQLSKHIVPNRGGVGLDHRTLTILTKLYEHMDSGSATTDASATTALVSHTLVTYLRNTPGILSNDELTHLLDHFGYSAELQRMNALDAVRLISSMVGDANSPVQYYSLRGGLSQLINRLVAWLQQHGAVMVLGRSVVALDAPTAKSPYFIVYASSLMRKEGEECSSQLKYTQYRATHLHLALPKESLLQYAILRPIHPWLNTVVTVPLCRIYAVFRLEPDTGRPWFYGIKKQALNSPLRWFIPINEATGVAMVAYTDDHFAQYWHEEWHRGGATAIKQLVRTHLSEAFRGDVPYPKKIRIAYWPSGVGYWAPRRGALANMTTQDIAQHIARPLGPDVNLHILGENYSWSHQQWMEGALS